jgi:hypothetical protein
MKVPNRTDLLLWLGLALIILCGTAQTPEVAARLHSAGFITAELNRLDRARVRLEAPGRMLTEAQERRRKEDLAEIERMRARLYSGP